MITTKKKLLAFVVIGMFLFMGAQAVIGTASAATNTSSVPNGGNFILGTTETELITNQNPLTTSGLAGDVVGITYADSLIYQFSNSSYFIPWLASGYNVTNGGKTITFNIVHNAYWMNGTQKAMQLTSKDIAFTFKVLASNSTLDVNGVTPYIKNISTPSPYTVIFNLTQANVMMFDYIGTQTIIPYAWHSYYSNLSNIGNYTNLNIGHQLSLGPMILKNFTTDSVNLVANPYFFKGKPHFASETISEFKSSSSMVQALEAGSIDGTYVDPNNLYNQINNYTGLKAVAYKTTYDLNLWFDDHIAPFNNTDFRVGLSYAINKTAILNKAEDGLGGQVSFGGLPWTLSAYYNGSVSYHAFNFTTANKYFKLAGLHIDSAGYWAYANGTEVQVPLMDLSLGDWDSAMTLIENNLKADHFHSTFTVEPTQVWATDIFSQPNFNQASLFNFGPLTANPWFDLWAAYDYKGYWNFEHYSNATVNKLLNESATMVTQPTQLNKTLKQIEGIVSQQMPVVPLIGTDVYYAYNTNIVGGFNPHAQLISPLDSLYGHMTKAPSNSSPISPILLYSIIGVVIVAIIGGAAYGVVRSRKRKAE